MSDSGRFRRYAAECLNFANDESMSEGDRQSFIEMARTWTQAAAAHIDVTVPEIVSEITEVKATSKNSEARIPGKHRRTRRAPTRQRGTGTMAACVPDEQ